MLDAKITKLIAIYARVSTGRQENEQTIESQLLAMRDLVKDKGYLVVQEYIDDGWSGDLIARPALDNLRGDAKKKIWEAVLFYDPDRIARAQWLQGLIMHELEEAGREVMFYTIATPKSDEDKVMFAMRGVMAQYEKMRIAERFRLGKQRKVKEGHILTTEAPYGYTYIPKKDKVHGYYVINEQEAKIVRMIFSWVADEKMTIRAIVRKLQELKIPPRESKRGVWNTSTLSTLLRRKAYIGEAHYGKSYAVIPEKPLKNETYKKIKKTSRRTRPEEEWVKIPVPAIIDEELFNRARKQLTDNFALCQRNKKNDYLLSGKIFCNCGHKRTGEGPQRGKHLYYRCTDRVYSFPLPPQCRSKGVNARVADAKVWEKIQGLMSSPDLIMRQAEEWLGAQHTKSVSSQGSIAELKKEIEKLKQEEERYVKAYGMGIITLEQLKEHTSDIRGKISALEGQISQLSQQERQSQNVILPTREGLESFCQEAREMLGCLGFKEKQKIISGVVEKIIGDREKLSVSGYLPLTLSNYVKFNTIHRNCGVAECGQVHAVLRHHKKTG